MVSTPELRNRQTVHNVNVNCQLWSLLIICGFLHNVRFWTVGFGTLGIQINYDLFPVMLSGYLLLQPKSYFPAFLCVTLNLFLMWKLWMLLRDMVQWFAFDLRCPHLPPPVPSSSLPNFLESPKSSILSEQGNSGNSHGLSYPAYQTMSPWSPSLRSPSSQGSPVKLRQTSPLLGFRERLGDWKTYFGTFELGR